MLVPIFKKGKCNSVLLICPGFRTIFEQNSKPRKEVNEQWDKMHHEFTKDDLC